MVFNPNSFFQFPVTDTCSVWHTLSSSTLYRIALSQGCSFVVTNFVVYELLYKSRKASTPQEIALRHKLIDCQKSGDFQSHRITIDDLTTISSLINRKNLGIGEISSICFAKKTGIAFQTDDRRAVTLATEILGTSRVQTTCYLLGWLVFRAAVTDGQVDEIIQQHEAMGGKMGKWFRSLNELGLQFRLMQSQQSTQ